MILKILKLPNPRKIVEIKINKVLVLTFFCSIFFDYLFINHSASYFIRALTHEAGIFKTVAFVLVYIFLHFSIAIGIHLQALRYIFIPVFSLSVGINFGYQEIQGAPFTLSDLETVLLSYELAGEALNAFQAEILAALLCSIIFFLSTSVLSRLYSTRDKRLLTRQSNRF